MTAIGHIYKIICTVDEKFCYIGSTFNRLSKRFETHRDFYIRWQEGKNKNKCSCCPYFKKYGIQNFKIVLIKSYEVCRAHVKDRKHLEAYETLWICKSKCVNVNMPIKYLKKEQNKQWYKMNRESITERHRAYREANKTEIAEYHKNYREEHKTEIAEKRKVYQESHKTEIAERHRSYYQANKESNTEKHRAYREANKESITEKQRVRYQANKEKINERHRSYYQANKESITEKHRAYREAHRTEIAEKARKKLTCQCGSVVNKCNMTLHCKSKKHQKYLEIQKLL